MTQDVAFADQLAARRREHLERLERLEREELIDHFMDAIEAAEGMPAEFER